METTNVPTIHYLKNVAKAMLLSAAVR